MAVFVVDDVGVEVAVAVRRGGVPEIHLHARPLPSGGVAKFALLTAAAVLGLGIDGSLPTPPLPKLFVWKLPADSVKP